MTRSRLLSVFALSLLVSIPAVAQKRRAVAHPSAGTAFQATVRGSVIDAATGAPVRSAIVKFGNRVDATTDQGTFVLTNATAFGEASVTVTRSGYETGTQIVKTTGTHELVFRLNSKPTVTVRLTNGTNRTVDFEESRFGYALLFGGYITVDQYCKANGTQVLLTPAEMKRVAGPATLQSVSSCCDHPAQKVNVQLRNGETTDAVFVDSCTGYSVDFIARDHTGGQFVYTKMTDVAEIVFP